MRKGGNEMKSKSVDINVWMRRFVLTAFIGALLWLLAFFIAIFFKQYVTIGSWMVIIGLLCVGIGTVGLTYIVFRDYAPIVIWRRR